MSVCRYLTVPRLTEALTGRPLQVWRRTRFLQSRQLVLGRTTAEAVDVESVLPDP